MVKEIYFDNSATTRPSPAVVDMMLRTLTEDFGNPSAMHKKGMDAERYIREARKTVADTLKVSPGEIIFTSGGTESNNFALIGTALANRRRGTRIVTTPIEHAAVSEPLKFLKKQGFIVETVPVDGRGLPDMDALRGLLTEDTILVSAMFVNNEIGTVLPVGEIGAMVKKMCPLALFHVDAIQAYGKFRIDPRTLGIDLMSVSGHKLHGPKGSGFLYIRSGSHLVPVIYGGGQQDAMRSGTENVPAIAGLGVAAGEAYEGFEEKREHLWRLREKLAAGLSGMDRVVIHGLPGREGAPHILNAAFPGVRSEVLLHALEDRGIYISAGSACSTHKNTASSTLTAIGVPREELNSSVRFSFSIDNTEEEVEETLRVLAEILPMLRRYRAR